jgi:2'-5' RNA ligase
MTASRSDNEGAETIRTFVCIEIPESIKRRIGELQKALARMRAPVSWTRPSNVHLTLKFLGAVSASRIEGVSRAVERAARGMGPFEIEVGGVGCFPSIRNARVLWIGVSSTTDKLSDLYSNLETRLEEEGFPRESRDFSPHLTIGRVRIPGKGAAVAEQLAARGFDNERFTATEVIVMRSDLKPTGSVYTRQSVIEL